MQERWVCKHCFADNDGTATVCARCGQARGSEAPLGAAGVGPATQPDAPAQGLGRYARFAWIPILIVVVAVGWFAASGQRALEELEVGHCFDAAEDLEISEVDRKDCTEPHTFEVIHVVDWPRQDDAYPTDAEQEEFVIAECLPAFGAYVGEPYETSALDLFYLSPTSESWSDGDREFVCAAYDPANAALTGSVRDSER